MHRLTAALLAGCMLVAGLGASAAPGLTGTWSGMLDFGGAPLLFVITIADAGNGLTATATSPYQGGGAIPVDSIAESNGSLKFSIEHLGATFAGTVAANAISGTFTQRGTSVPLVLAPSSIGTSDLAGTWLGSLAAPGGSLLLVLHVRDEAGGALTATFDSPFQHAFGMPIEMSRTNATLSFALAKAGASYEGTIGPDAIAGTFSQSGMTFPLTFARPGAAAPPTPAPAATALPTPAPNFSSRNVTFASSGGAVLAGTLTVPKGRSGRMPAFVFVHGSGPGTRNAAIPQNPTFLLLSNALSNAGVVVLRYDKRGIGASTGTATEDWRPLGDDVRAAVALLRAQPSVDPHRIYLLGHSEGGLVVPLVAPTIPGLAGIVLMAPPAIPMAQIIEQQSARMTPAMKAATLQAFAAYDGIDPAQVIRKVGCPVLVLQGSRDLQVLPSDLHHLTDGYAGAAKHVTVDVLQGDDHLFITIAPSHPDDGSEYDVPSPLDPRVARSILAWMAAQSR